MEFFAYYIVLTMSYCSPSDGTAACEPREDTYYFQNAVHCEQVRQEMSLMYRDFYTNVDLKSASCEALIVELDGNRLPMWKTHKEASKAAQAQIEYAREALGIDQKETD